MGNASETDTAKIQTEFAQVLASGEGFEKAYQFNKKLNIYAVQAVLAGYVRRWSS